MKRIKIAVAALLFCLGWLSAGMAAFAWNGASAPRVVSVRHAAFGGVQSVTLKVDGYDSAETISLTNPERFVIDVKGLSAPIKQQELSVGVGPIVAVRYAQLEAATASEPASARFVIDLSARPQSEFKLMAGKGYIKIELASGAKNSDTVFSFPEYGEEDGIAGQPSAQGAAQNGSAQAGRSPAPSPAPAPSPGAARTPRPSPAAAATPTPAPAASAPLNSAKQDEYVLNVASDFTVTYSAKGDENKLTLALPEGASARAVVSELKSPYRVVIDVPAALPSSAPNSIVANDDVLKSVSLSQNGRRRTRITLEMNGGAKYETAREGSKLILSLTNAMLDNLGYYNSGARTMLTLYGAALTEGSEDIAELYDIAYRSEGKVCSITFDSSAGFLEAGTVKIDDSLVRSVSVRKRGSKTTLSISANAAIVCSAFTKNDPGAKVLETTVSIIPKLGEGERHVVIDAGHGGSAPGAIGLDGTKEKDVVLDIALRLKQILDGMGVRTFLTRDADYDVDLYERARLANDLGAGLFLSIHANAADNNREANGIETLFCPQPGTGANAVTAKQFAELTQGKVTSMLQLTDRKTKERPNLVVLRKTRMPAILVETAFLSNSGDLALLRGADFRDGVASALAEAVRETLDLAGGAR